MANISDDALWRRVGHDDKDAFGELFERYGRRVHGYCFRRTGNTALAQDLASVVFMEAWRRRAVVVKKRSADEVVRIKREAASLFGAADGRLDIEALANATVMRGRIRP